MPTIFVSIPPARLTIAARQALAAHLTELVATIMRKRAEVTSVRVLEMDIAGWTIGGKPADLAAHAEVTVTQGTNTPEEKAAMVHATHAALAEALPGLPEATYVIIREIAADGWGYGGMTQAARAFVDRSAGEA